MDQPGKQTILVIDDNKVIIELIERTLGRAGYRVVGCADPRGYREACSAERPALIVLDIFMPGKSGWEILEELRADPGLADIPVIISSVKGRPEDIERGREMGAVDFVAKPYVLGDLVEIIRSHVG